MDSCQFCGEIARVFGLNPNPTHELTKLGKWNWLQNIEKTQPESGSDTGGVKNWSSTSRFVPAVWALPASSMYFERFRTLWTNLIQKRETLMWDPYLNNSNCLSWISFICAYIFKFYFNKSRHTIFKSSTSGSHGKVPCFFFFFFERGFGLILKILHSLLSS